MFEIYLNTPSISHNKNSSVPTRSLCFCFLGRVGHLVRLETAVFIMAKGPEINVTKRILDSQIGSRRAFRYIHELPLDVVKAGEKRLISNRPGSMNISQIVYNLAKHSSYGSGKICYDDCTRAMKDFKEICSNHHEDDINESCAYVKLFDTFGGIQLVLDIFLRSSMNSAKDLKKAKGTISACFQVFHIVYNIYHRFGVPLICNSLVERKDLVSCVFSLVTERVCSSKAATFLEDLINIKPDLIKLQEITHLNSIITYCGSEQLANLCRIFSLAISDLDHLCEDRATLAAQDKIFKNQKSLTVPEVNQKILVDSPGFVKMIVTIACNQLNSTPVSLSSLLLDSESWFTWLDSSLAFDALAEIADENGDVFLNIPSLVEEENLNLHEAVQVMHTIMFKVEVLYIISMLLHGKERDKMHELVAEYGLMPGLSDLFYPVIWKCNLKSDPHPGTCDCSPEVALKIQFLRMVHSYCDHHHNKYLLLTWDEIEELKRIAKHHNVPVSEGVKNVKRDHLCRGRKGLLTKLVEVLKSEEQDSTFRFWLARAIESFLRGQSSVHDQIFLLNMGLLEYVVKHMVQNNMGSGEVLQSSFDLLGELIKFNADAFRRFDMCLKSEAEFKCFTKLITDHMVDSNMFARCLILSLERATQEQPQYSGSAATESKLLQYIMNRELRLKYLCSLIDLIRVATLTQENVSCLNTTVVMLMFALQKKELTGYLWSIRDEELNQHRPGYLLNNFRELLEFWQDHYSCREKDCLALEKSSRINFEHWKETIRVLMDQDKKLPTSLAHYLPTQDLNPFSSLLTSPERSS